MSLINQYRLDVGKATWGVTGTLMRYDPQCDRQVPVTMDWVNEISIENARLSRELHEAKKKLASYSEPEMPTDETERMWRALVCAARS